MENTSDTPRPESEAYDATALQEKWLPIWQERHDFTAGRAGDTRPRKYVLDMFPYPSGDLHMGHAEAFGFGDTVARTGVTRVSMSCTRLAGIRSGCRLRM